MPVALDAHASARNEAVKQEAYSLLRNRYETLRYTETKMLSRRESEFISWIKRHFSNVLLAG